MEQKACLQRVAGAPHELVVGLSLSRGLESLVDSPIHWTEAVCRWGWQSRLGSGRALLERWIQ